MSRAWMTNKKEGHSIGHTQSHKMGFFEEVNIEWPFLLFGTFKKLKLL
ncbi:mCG148373 [Mus musculus]|jgi:hypothetical protein|nr:mCG148373 [Mus musculus]